MFRRFAHARQHLRWRKEKVKELITPGRGLRTLGLIATRPLLKIIKKINKITNVIQGLQKAKYKMEITVTIFKMISIGLYRRDVIGFLLSFL